MAQFRKAQSNMGLSSKNKRLKKSMMSMRPPPITASFAWTMKYLNRTRIDRRRASKNRKDRNFSWEGKGQNRVKP